MPSLHQSTPLRQVSPSPSTLPQDPHLSRWLELMGAITPEHATNPVRAKAVVDQSLAQFCMDAIAQYGDTYRGAEPTSLVLHLTDGYRLTMNQDEDGAYSLRLRRVRLNALPELIAERHTAASAAPLVERQDVNAVLMDELVDLARQVFMDRAVRRSATQKLRDAAAQSNGEMTDPLYRNVLEVVSECPPSIWRTGSDYLTQQMLSALQSDTPREREFLALLTSDADEMPPFSCGTRTTMLMIGFARDAADSSSREPQQRHLIIGYIDTLMEHFSPIATFSGTEGSEVGRLFEAARKQYRGNESATRNPAKHRNRM